MMLRRLLRSTLVGTAIVAATSIPSTASAQAYYFSSCATPGVCGYVEAFFTGTLLTVRLSNMDAAVGSALYNAQLIFTDALQPASPGSAFNATATATTEGAVTSIGTTPADSWSFGGVGGSTILDLSAFFNAYIEGPAASSFRALPGDPDNGTWVTNGGDVQFTADMASLAGVNSSNKFAGFGFCTDQGCMSGEAQVVTPEPATLTLVATGLIGLVTVRRRRKTV